MNIVNRVRFPHTVDASDLYIRIDENSSIDFQTEISQITFQEGSHISFNTYFNSIYESFCTKYTTLSTLQYLLKLEGDFEISAYRETCQLTTKELIYRQTIQNCQLSDYVKVVLPELKQDQKAGRIYLEITCLSKQGLFTEGLVITEQEKQRDVSLGIITCTFKKETYIKKTVSAISQDSFLRDKQIKVFIVDNGRTLHENDFEDSRVRLISNRNVGGSGGFTKGLIEALQENIYTHFLLMDDDIDLDSESIYRLICLYEYGKQEFAVAGTMLDLYKKHILYEAGSLYNKYIDDQGNIQHHLFITDPLKQNLDLQQSASLNFLLQEDNIDYGGFWFFALSRKMVEKLGLLLPFFIRVDDIEYGLRINKYFSNHIVAFPSLAVWHEPFYAKRTVWDIYYTTRNNLITASYYANVKYFDVVKDLTIAMLYSLFAYDYNMAQMYVKGLEDYMQGPNFFKDNDLERLHEKISQYSKIYQSQTVLKNPVSVNPSSQMFKASKFQKVLSLITLNGHLLPKYFIQDKTTFIRWNFLERESSCKAFATRRVIIKMEHNPNYFQNEMDQKVGINIVLTWLKLVIKSFGKWSKVVAEWKEAFSELTSIPFWQNYLKSSEQQKSQNPTHIKSEKTVLIEH